MARRYRREPGDIKRLKSIKAEEYKEGVAKLLARRKAAELTQRELAKLLGESQTWVSNVENRQRRIDIYEAGRWQQACREHIAQRAVARAIETFAALAAAVPSKAAGAVRSAPSVAPIVAGGASTSQPEGTALPVAAEPVKALASGETRSALPDDAGGAEPASATDEAPPRPGSLDAPPKQPDRG
jgi:transcriptional regulator with XRE-family HTH domain